MLAVIAISSFASCTVRYRAHHPRRYHHYNYTPPVNQKSNTVSVLPQSSAKVQATR
jgi:hypothetical protein